MPCSLLTIHAYRSWMPDRDRGYVKQGRILPRDDGRAKRYANHAAHQPVEFDRDMLTFMHSGVIDIAEHRNWRVHAAFGEPTHFHIMISWNAQTRPPKLRQLIVNLLSTFLGRWRGQPGRRWFVRRPSFKPVGDRDHFDHLIGSYRKKHTFYQWVEGEPPPPPLSQYIDIRRK